LLTRLAPLLASALLAACGAASAPGASGGAQPSSSAAAARPAGTTVTVAVKGSPSEAALSASLFNALGRGINIRMVADYSHVGSPDDSGLALLVRKDLLDSGAVKSLADLKGQVVGLGTNHGTVSDFLWAHALQKNGLSGLDVEIKYLQFPDIFSALSNGQMAAGTLTQPLVAQAEEKGIARVFYPAGAVILGSELSILQYSPQFAADQDAATRFMVGYLQGARDHYQAFHTNDRQARAAAIDLLVEHTALKDKTVWDKSSPSNIDLNGNINVDDLINQANFYKQQGTLTGAVPDVRQYVDQRFAEAAVRQLGKR
jgi:NitT/TauT family transport system substrate-binding protein